MTTAKEIEAGRLLPYSQGGSLPDEPEPEAEPEPKPAPEPEPEPEPET